MFGGGWSQGEPARVRVPANEVRSRLEVPQSRRLGDRGVIDRKGPILLQKSLESAAEW